MKEGLDSVKVGIFAVVAVVLAVIAILLFGDGKLPGKTIDCVLYFDGSVKGLSVGSDVTFRGVKIGSVSDIVLTLSDTGDVRIPVLVELEPDRIRTGKTDEGTAGHRERLEQLIERGLRAELQLQSLVTGQLMIQLDLHPDEPAGSIDRESKILELPTIQSSLEKLSRTVEDLPIEEMLNRINRIAEGIERLVNDPKTTQALYTLAESLEEVQKILEGIEQRFTPTVDRAEEILTTADGLLKKIDGRIEPIAQEINGTLRDTRSLVNSSDRRLEQTANAIETASKNVSAEASRTVKQIGSFLESTEERLGPILTNAENVTAETEAMLVQGSDFRYRLEETLEELTEAARSLRVLCDSLERNPESLLRGRKDQ